MRDSNGSGQAEVLYYSACVGFRRAASLDFSMFPRSVAVSLANCATIEVPFVTLAVGRPIETSAQLLYIAD